MARGLNSHGSTISSLDKRKEKEMKVRRSSWHYKIRNLGVYPPDNENFCRYCRTLAFNLFIILILTTTVAEVAYKFFSDPFWISNSIMVLFGVTSVFLPMLSISFIRKRLGHPVKVPQETLIIEYLKTKKNKFCPMIEYVD